MPRSALREAAALIEALGCNPPLAPRREVPGPREAGTLRRGASGRGPGKAALREALALSRGA